MTLFNQLKPLIGVIILLASVLGFAVADASGAEVPDGERNLVYGAVLTALVYEGREAVRELRVGGTGTTTENSPGGTVTIATNSAQKRGDTSRGRTDPGG